MPNTNPSQNNFRLIRFAGLAVILAPIAYLCGRFTSDMLNTPMLNSIGPQTAATALGALLGIPVGLFFGSLRPAPAIYPAPISPATTTQTPSASLLHKQAIAQEDKLLAQLRQELQQAKTMFDARKGNQAILARISYPTPFWTSIRASGQLFVVQDPALLGTIAMAYYWIEQANRIESLAFESKYITTAPDNQNATSHLIAEARMLDAPLENSLSAALSAIDNQSNIQTPPTSPSGASSIPAPYSH